MVILGLRNKKMPLGEWSSKESERVGELATSLVIKAAPRFCGVILIVFFSLNVFASSVDDLSFCGDRPSSEQSLKNIRSKIETALKSNPHGRSKEFLFGVANCYMVAEDYEAALNYASLASDAGLNPYEFYLLSSEAYLALGDYKKAEDSANKAIRFDTYDLSEYLFLVQVFLASGNYDRGLQLLNKRLKKEKLQNIVVPEASNQIFYNEVELYMMISGVHYNSGNKGEAKEVLMEGFSRNNASSEIFGALLYLLGQLNLLEDLELLRKNNCSRPIFLSMELCK